MADLSSPYWNAIIRAVNLFGKSMASLDIHFAILDSYLLVPFNNLDSIDPFLPFLRFIYTILEEQSHEIISNSRWAEKLDKILGVLAKDFQRDRALTYQSLFEEMIAQTNYVKLPLETKDRIFAIYRSILSVTRQSPPDRFSIFIMSTFSPYHCSLPSIVPLIADILDIIFKAESHKLDGNSRLAGISPSPYHSNLVVPEIGQKVLPPRKRLAGHDDQTVQIEPDCSMEPTTTIAFSYASPMKIFVDVLKEHVEKIGVSSDPRSVLNIFESIECLLRAAVNVPFCIELESLSILVCQISKRVLSWFSQMQDKEIATFEVYFCLCRLVESVVPKETDLLLLKNVDTQLQHAILALSAIAFPQLIPPLNALSIPAPPSLSQVPSEAAARFRATGLQLLFSTLHLPVGRTHQWYTPVSKILFPTLRSADDTEMIIGFRGLSVFVSVIPVNEIEPFLLDCGTLIKLPSTLSAAAFTEIAQTISKLPCIIHQRRSQGDIIDKSNKCTVCAQSYSGELKSIAPPGIESIDLSFLVPFASFCEDHHNSAPAICKSVFARTLPIWLNHASSQEFILKENSLGQLLLQWTFNEAATVTEHFCFALFLSSSASYRCFLGIYCTKSNGHRSTFTTTFG
ncbi:hypothetical protein BKA69DRAFT_317993 [Paraphysoderma sedebokerense]|nr:hypothetical protein BKA69DRAFT_317997 [Paraphysoderma sedebokerense]KAI9146009.1 hypothetical protein BKA69DRAFT_317993 [Paraphysoderma sedebokerense]